MKKVNVSTCRYDILIEDGLLKGAGELIRGLNPSKAFLITDENVYSLYGKAMLDSLRGAGLSPLVIAVPPGEASKSVKTLEAVYEKLAGNSVSRGDVIIALGGGVVGDLAGFAAATILRGIRYVQIPTTLLSQVDSSVGGKTAVNLKAGKNLAGAFYQPSMTLIDPECLKTLPDREFSSGMSEVIKYGAILHEPLIELLESNRGRENAVSVCGEIIEICCRLKAEIVSEDEKEQGIRSILNFGHTFGHVYEYLGGYERHTHGQAVAAGMCDAVRIGGLLGVTPPEIGPRLEGLLRSFGLETVLSYKDGDFLPVLERDKKTTDGGKIKFILLQQLGKAKEATISLDELLTLYRRAKK